MRLSFSIFFLGWWLAGQLQMTKAQSSSNISISVSPSVVVALGGNVNISCKSDQHPQAELFLNLNWTLMSPAIKNAQTDGVVFSILKANLSDAGMYRCGYCHGPVCGQYGSVYSEGIYIYIRGQSYPKPSISVDPSQVVTLGGSVNIRCKSEQHQTVKFHLNKEGTLRIKREEPPKRRAEGDEAVFRIANAKGSDGGMYWCEYKMGGNNGLPYSYFSDRVSINITDPSLPKPSIKRTSREEISPHPDVGIECQGPEDGLTFFLHKSRDLVASQMAEPDRNTTKFPFFRMRLEDIGNYTCQYHLRDNPFVWSEPSDPVELVALGVFTASDSLSPGAYIRLGIAGIIFLSLVLIITQDLIRWKRGHF